MSRTEAEAEAEETNLKLKDNLKAFLSVHYKGLICIFVPIICIGVLLPFPSERCQWAKYVFLVMAVFWITECIPLPVTSLLPLVLFPITGVMSTNKVLTGFRHDSIFMYIGSLVLAASVEQSGLHKRMAFIAIRSFGYSHVKLLVALVAVTTFISMWIPNVAATAVMVPIIFAVLKVFEDQKLIKIYETTEDGDKIASDITTCYFCTATFSASIGSIGFLNSSMLNVNCKILFTNKYHSAPKYLSFTLFSAFSLPYMIVLGAFMILYILVVFVGFLRPNSAAAKRAKIPPESLKAAEATVNREYEALGKLTFWEFLVILLLGGAMVSFFCRSPEIFEGWGEAIRIYFDFKDTRLVRELTPMVLFTTLMFLLPCNLSFFDNCKAKFHEDLPTQRVPSVVNWNTFMGKIPLSFIFILVGVINLSHAALECGLEEKFQETLQGLKPSSNKVVLLLIIIFVILLTNVVNEFAIINVIVPASMQLAKKPPTNPLRYALATGFSSSYCFMLPTGAPGNILVKSCAKIPTSKMLKAGFGPTITSIIITWHALYLYAPIVWPDLNNAKPAWTK